MNYEEAEALLGEGLAPLGTEAFFDAVGRRPLFVKGSFDHPRRRLLGEDPRATLLGAFATHATRLEGHSVTATRPLPPPAPAADADAFGKLIASMHALDYTVRVPDIVPLAPPLQRFARAIEFLLHQQVQSYVFWSKAGAGAIVHYDNRDNIIIQLEGRKRWFISTDPPGLQNNWKQVGEPAPNLANHQVVDLEPGDLIYLPRGTPHTVDSATESLHLSILFVPLTLRESIIAALDFLSDHDGSFRDRVALRLTPDEFDGLADTVAAGVKRLLEECRSDDFIRNALQLRSARAIGDLPALPKPPAPQAPLTTETIVRHTPLAICNLRHALGVLDFSQPGGHIGIHPGVETELRFIGSTVQFRIGEIPGSSSLDVRIALVARLIDSGFLEVAGDV